MKLTLYTLVVFIMVSCGTTTKTIQGTYKSTCFIQKYPNVILKMNSDSSFEYNFAYRDEKVTGEWKLEKDTLYLYSNDFSLAENNALTPIRKNTSSPGYDAYLIKDKKLYILSTDKKKEKNCYLVKQ